jgi:hypothetical protein
MSIFLLIQSFLLVKVQQDGTTCPACLVLSGPAFEQYHRRERKEEITSKRKRKKERKRKRETQRDRDRDWKKTDRYRDRLRERNKEKERESERK